MRIYVLLLASVPINCTPDIIPDIISFEKAWVPFLSALSGCPGSEIPADLTICSASARRWDYALFIKSKKAAIKVFDLKAAQ